MKKIIKVSILILLAATILNAGIANIRNRNRGTKTSNTAQSKIINGSSQNKTITMNGGTLQISGSDNNVTVKGSATTIYVSGW